MGVEVGCTPGVESFDPESTTGRIRSQLSGKDRRLGTCMLVRRCGEKVRIVVSLDACASSSGDDVLKLSGMGVLHSELG